MDNKRKKIFVVYNLSIIYVAFAILFTKFGNYEFYFVNVHKYCRDINKILFLEKIGIIWIKKIYKKFSEHINHMYVAKSLAEIIYEKLNKSHTMNVINEILLQGNVQIDKKEKIVVMWKYYIYRAISSYAQQQSAAEYLLTYEKNSKIIIISFNPWIFLINKTIDRRIKIVALPGFLPQDSVVQIIKFMKNVIVKGYAILKSKRKEILSSQITHDFAHIDRNRIEVIYFPHQGIFYGNLFKKDQFYNQDNASVFNMKNILHISLGEYKRDFMFKSHKYYIDNNIPFTDINNLSYSKKELIKYFCRLLKKNNLHVLKDLRKYGFWYISYMFFLFLTIIRYRIIFSGFPELKMALVGYDHLFPRNLSLALSLNNIKVCASQERFIFAFWPDTYYIFDYYFVAGDVVKNERLSDCAISECVPVGLIRVDNLYGYEKEKLYDFQYDTIKLKRKLILALDYHMPPSEIEDFEMDPAARISTTRQFYEDLIKLSLEFPSIFIVIKGKNADSYKSRFIKDLVDKINKIENIKIELDLEKYDPYYISEKADLTIVCHNSLADELLAAGRPVVFYEGNDLINTLFDYHQLPIIVTNYAGLRYHIDNFLNGVYLDNVTIRKIQKEFYNDCYHGHVSQGMRAILEEVVLNE
jgi:hypothetical protein